MFFGKIWLKAKQKKLKEKSKKTLAKPKENSKTKTQGFLRIYNQPKQVFKKTKVLSILVDSLLFFSLIPNAGV